MSFWKKDLLLVNGYNEAFTGWGREDSDMAIRLMNSGINKKFLKMGGIVYHLYHKEANRDNEERNTAMMEEAIQNNYTRCKKGVNQYF
jgi:predicted glycosyltransferase involved in capsule biosynthesis